MRKQKNHKNLNQIFDIHHQEVKADKLYKDPKAYQAIHFHWTQLSIINYNKARKEAKAVNH